MNVFLKKYLLLGGRGSRERSNAPFQWVLLGLIPVAVAPEPEPPKELSTVDHVANAFASTSRANNLETIDFTVESLAVTGAAAPAFLLKTDERGRRPVSRAFAC